MIKKVIGVLLCLCLTAASLPLVSRAEGRNRPYILVSGMDVMPLSMKTDKGKDKKVWPMGAGTALGLAAKIVPPALRFILDKDYEKLGAAVIPAAAKALEPLSCGEDGGAKHPVYSPEYYGSMKDFPEVYKGEKKDEQGILNAAVKKYGAENVYFFNYDWRLSPLDHIEKLDRLIDLALKEHGCEKADLACCSMGGNIVTCYLGVYGSEKLHSVTLLSTAFQGVAAVGEMLGGELYFEKRAVIRRMTDLGKTKVTHALYSALMALLDKTGIAGRLMDFANSFIEKNKEALYEELLIPIFGSMPGIWALVKSEDYEKASAYALGDGSGILREKTERFLNGTQRRAAPILSEAMENGAKVYIVCQYDYQCLPVSKNCDINNDLMVDLDGASGGAFCADLESELPEDYVQKVSDGHDHISPDRVIDASCCMLPEQTWFIKRQAHVDYPVGSSTDFIFALSDSEEQADIRSFESYPQFMIYDYDTDKLTPTDQASMNSTR